MVGRASRVRGLEAVAVLAYAACWVFGVFEALTRRLPWLPAAVIAGAEAVRLADDRGWL